MVVTENCLHDEQFLRTADMELRLFKPLSPIISENEILPTLSPQETEMARKDSGWSESPLPTSQPSSRRNSKSTSASRRNSPSKTSRNTHRPTNSSSSSTRPSTRRASKSASHAVQLQSRCVFTQSRPSLNARHTIQCPSTPPHQSIPQFFHFPHFPSPESVKPSPLPLQPPPTVNYWTSDRTRRMEYAAIDAAGQGIRGFVNKLIPECMLSKDFKQRRFCNGDEGSDAGSVRRYRLDLPAEQEEDNSNKKNGERMGFFRRLSGGLKKAN